MDPGDHQHEADQRDPAEGEGQRVRVLGHPVAEPANAKPIVKPAPEARMRVCRYASGFHQPDPDEP